MKVIAFFLDAVETERRCLEAASDVLMRLIPKPSGGRRPLAVLATLVRIWERVRKPVVREGAARNHKAYDWTARGRSAEAAAWTQSR